MKSRHFFAPDAIEIYRRRPLHTLRPLAPWLIVGAAGLLSLAALLWSLP